jgi:hypothetical protein
MLFNILKKNCYASDQLKSFSQSQSSLNKFLLDFFFKEHIKIFHYNKKYG